MNKEKILQEFRNLRIELHDTVLGTAVSREANIDLYLKNDVHKQEKLKNAIRGLTIIHYFAFLQSHIESLQWDYISNHLHGKRKNYPAIDWDGVDIFYYIRNCFAHNWQGELFPLSQKNTIIFLSLHQKHTELANLITTSNNTIQIGTTLLCFNLIYKILEIFIS
ncbi:MAG: hypothetical protein ACTSYI_02825 [Promethearchaeota archaeon]